MANPSKRKGSAFEGQVAGFLAEVLSLPVERRVLSGVNDRGDIAGVPEWTFECKATTAIDLAGGMAELRREQANANTPFGALIVKKRMAGVGDAYAVMTLEQLARLIWNLRRRSALH